MTLNLSTLETRLWDAASSIRGPVDAPKFKDYILPLIFLKRLSEVSENELARLSTELAQHPTNAAHAMLKLRQQKLVHTTCLTTPHKVLHKRKHSQEHCGMGLSEEGAKCRMNATPAISK